VISTLKDGDRYLDACVRTRGRFEHAFGYFLVDYVRVYDLAPNGFSPLARQE
jgi:hypothetical protein